MKKFFSLFVLLYLAAPLLQAQAPLLRAEEAVALALENHYGIRIAKADVEIAHANNTRANAGMLPTINFVANENFTLSAFQQNLANGAGFDELGAPFNAASAAVQLNWTLYDGKRMYIAKNRLEATEALSQLQLQNLAQQTSAEVLQAYYDIVRSQLQETALEEVIALNTERLRIAQARLEAGFAAQTDALQAEIELNQRKSDLLNQKNTSQSAKRQLNQLLARDPNTPFDVEGNLQSDFTPNPSQFLDQIQNNNPGLLALRKTAEIAAIAVNETRTLGKARLIGNSQLNAQRSDNGAGFVLNNTQAGLSVGATLQIPLYTGGNIKRQVQVAEIQALQANTAIEAQTLALNSALQDLIDFYNTQKAMLALEDSNVEAARKSLQISTERFRLGQTNALEPQSAQNLLEQALLRRNLNLYNLKISEIQLRLLAGQL